jgi:hypothetical protein
MMDVMNTIHDVHGSGEELPRNLEAANADPIVDYYMLFV